MLEKYQKIILFCFILLISTIMVADRINVDYVKIDFASYYYAGEAAENGANYYDYKILSESGIELQQHLYPYIYTPILAQVFSILPSMGVLKIQMLWSLLSLLSFIVTLYLLSDYISNKYFKDKRKIFYTFRFLLPIVIIFITPYRYIFFVGQIDIFILLLLTLGFIGLEKENDVFAGTMFAIAAALKILPALFIIYPLIAKKYRTISSFIISFILCCLFSVVFFGTSDWINFWGYLTEYSANDALTGLDGIASAANSSLQGFLSRCFETTNIKYFAYIIDFALLIIIILKTFKLKDYSRFIITITAFMLIVTPITWRQHNLYFIPGLLFYLAYLLNSKNKLSYTCFFSMLILVFLAQFDFITNSYKYLGTTINTEIPFISILAILVLSLLPSQKSFRN